MNATKRPARKIRRGIALKSSLHKTTTVVVERKFRHLLYPKVLRRTARFKVHDEKNLIKAGDLVEIMETRPISKTKRWRLVRVVPPAAGGEPAPGQ